jgi:hypothetical protein
LDFKALATRMGQPYAGLMGLGLILVLTINLFPFLSIAIGAPHPTITVYLFTVAFVINLTVPFGLNYSWRENRRKAIAAMLFSWVTAFFLTVIFASDLYPNAGLLTRPLMKAVYDLRLFGPATGEISLLWVEFILWNLVITLGLWNTCFNLYPFKQRGLKTGLTVLAVSTILALTVASTWDSLLGVPWGRNPAAGLGGTAAELLPEGSVAYWHWVRLTNIMWSAILIGVGPASAHIWHNHFARNRPQPQAGLVNFTVGLLTVLLFTGVLWAVGATLYPGWDWRSPMADFPGFGGAPLLEGLNPYMIMTLWIGGTTLQGFLWAYLLWDTFFEWWPFSQPSRKVLMPATPPARKP